MERNSQGVDVSEAIESSATIDDGLCFNEAVEAIVKRFMSNHGNSRAFYACLSVCRQRLPYREAEILIDQRPELDISTQNAHVLLQAMIDCGGVEAVKVSEPEYASHEEKQDMPVGYIVQTTKAGLAALAQFEPVKQFDQVLQTDPPSYASAYAAVLERCLRGATKIDIEQTLKGNEALSNPKQIYPSYFISRLETVGGLMWNGSWKTTDEGRRMLSLVE